MTFKSHHFHNAYNVSSKFFLCFIQKPLLVFHLHHSFSHYIFELVHTKSPATPPPAPNRVFSKWFREWGGSIRFRACGYLSESIICKSATDRQTLWDAYTRAVSIVQLLCAAAIIYVRFAHLHQLEKIVFVHICGGKEAPRGRERDMRFGWIVGAGASGRLTFLVRGSSASCAPRFCWLLMFMWWDVWLCRMMKRMEMVLYHMRGKGEGYIYIYIISHSTGCMCLTHFILMVKHISCGYNVRFSFSVFAKIRSTWHLRTHIWCIYTYIGQHLCMLLV